MREGKDVSAGKTPVQRFYTFLERFRVKKGERYNFTLTAKPFGAFFVPENDLDGFYAEYVNAIGNDSTSASSHPSLTEKPGTFSPVLIDLDFKYKLNAEGGQAPERKHTNQLIDRLIGEYTGFLGRYLDLSPRECECYVFERPAPYQTDKYVKDGVHLIFPHLHPPSSLKFIARDHLCRTTSEMFRELGTVNSIGDIIDEAVIDRNNWYLYGSGKQGCEPYRLVRIVGKDLEAVQNNEQGSSDLVRLLSVRGEATPRCTFKSEDMEAEVGREFEALRSREHGLEKRVASLSSAKRLAKFTKCDNLELVQKLVQILDSRRAESYKEWIELGWCLHNIHDDLLSDWVEFSQRSPKFTPGDCERRWAGMKEDGLGMGSLVRWAQDDDPEGYAEIKQNDLRSLIDHAQEQDGAHYAVAKVLYARYKYTYVCMSRKFKTWIEFRGNKWYRTEEGFGLLCKISTELRQLFLERAKEQGRLGAESDSKTNPAKEAEKALRSIAKRLLDSGYKASLMTQLYELFYVEGFEELLDSNPQLIGFDNGVYDLDAMEFREGRPEDCISLGTGHDYEPYDPADPLVQKVERIVRQIHTQDDIREYILKMLASCLSGQIRQHHLIFFTGSGSNGKSQLTDMFMQGFGTYATVLPISLLTSKRNASNAASPELARVKGRRFCVLQEPDNDVKLNVGLMKELTGGDTIVSRDLFCPIVEFKPQFKLVLTCNVLPDISARDGGTWRRVRVCEFRSKFCDNPDPNVDTEFPVDIDLASQVEELGCALISLLIPYYKKYREEGLAAPEAVLAFTRDYQKRCDNFLDFVSEYIVPSADKNDVIRLVDVYGTYKEWFRQNQPDSARLPGSKDLKDYINSKYTPSPNNNWRGYTLRSVEDPL